MPSTYTRTLAIDSTRAVDVRFTHAAMQAIEETGVDPQVGLDSLLDGVYTPASLLDYCLDGADDDRIDGWRDYVSALAVAAGL